MRYAALSLFRKASPDYFFLDDFGAAFLVVFAVPLGLQGIAYSFSSLVEG